MRHLVASCLTASCVLLAAACGGDDASQSPATASGERDAAVANDPSREPTVTTQPGTIGAFTVGADPSPQRGSAVLQAIRVGAHPENGGWDRIVFEFKDGRPALEVGYIDKAVTCGKGDGVTLPGVAILSVRFRQTQAHTDAGASTLPSRDIPGPGNAILKSAVICDFEGETQVVMGIKTKRLTKSRCCKTHARRDRREELKRLRLLHRR